MVTTRSRSGKAAVVEVVEAIVRPRSGRRGGADQVDAGNVPAVGNTRVLRSQTAVLRVDRTLRSRVITVTEEQEKGVRTKRAAPKTTGGRPVARACSRGRRKTTGGRKLSRGQKARVPVPGRVEVPSVDRVAAEETAPGVDGVIIGDRVLRRSVRSTPRRPLTEVGKHVVKRRELYFE